MSISRRYLNEENSSSDEDEETTNETFNPRLRMIGRYLKFQMKIKILHLI